jgi:putative DNA methylase
MNQKTIAKLIPDQTRKCYRIEIKSNASDEEINSSKAGTVGRDSKYGEASLIHEVNGITYKTKISTLRGDYQKADGSIDNQLRKWEKHDFMPRPEDLIQERLYCIQWMRPKNSGKGFEYDFRAATEDDFYRDEIVQKYVAQNLEIWQRDGWVPDMRIEVGAPPRYQGLDLIRARGWTYWHHVFNPRQILIASLVRQHATASGSLSLAYMLNYLSKLCVWDKSGNKGQNTFYNQALNTIFNFACRSTSMVESFLAMDDMPSHPIFTSTFTSSIPATELKDRVDFFVTDPPYGDAVKYEEVLDFFIAWLRKNPPPEFADWVWDSRRSLAIQGEDENFRRNMVAAYKRMTECMPDNGMQVIMFTHNAGSIWADMANIVWASGLQVNAAWYVATETDSAIRDGSHVKGTILLVCRKRLGQEKITRDDLTWDLQEEVENQVETLTGLNQQAKGLYRDENVFEDADIQMAGYAAALRVLTRYATIDGRDMTTEAIRPRVKGEVTFVDDLIKFAVDTANQCLVPQGIDKTHWHKLSGAERFYLKMVDLEARGNQKLDNYQNFAKAFKVKDFKVLMGDQRANHARLKSAVEFGRAEMGEGSQLHQTVLRAVLYALMELINDVDSDAVLAHLSLNIPNYYGDMTQRHLAVELADYLAKRLDEHRPDEASAARILRDLIQNQRLG